MFGQIFYKSFSELFIFCAMASRVANPVVLKSIPKIPSSYRMFLDVSLSIIYVFIGSIWFFEFGCIERIEDCL